MGEIRPCTHFHSKYFHFPRETLTDSLIHASTSVLPGKQLKKSR